MPKLSKHERPAIKVDAAGAVLDTAIPIGQVRGLWEKPGAQVVGIVTMASTSYTGHADGEEKAPTVRLRIISFEAARDNEEAAALLEAARALYRHRTWEGTFEEAGVEPIQDPASVLEVAFAQYPSEREFQDHLEAQKVLRQQQRDAEELARTKRQESLV